MHVVVDGIRRRNDPMIAKIIAWGPDRTSALRTLSGALAATHAEGISTNIEFLRRAVAHPAFVAGDVFTGFIDAFKPELVG